PRRARGTPRARRIRGSVPVVVRRARPARRAVQDCRAPIRTRVPLSGGRGGRSMTLADLTLHRLAIPFRTTFRHAAAERDATESALVVARSRRGVVGWGESCPRRYVTGEDFASVSRFFLRHRGDLIRRIRDVGDLVAWSDAHRD